MPTPRQIAWAKFRVLVVGVVAVCILIVLFYLFTGGTLLEPKVTLYLHIPDASGLDLGSPVRVDGITVGKVSSIALSGSNQPGRIILVAMRLRRSALADIPIDSTADTGSDTLLGDQYIGITSGRSPAHIAPGGEIALKPQTTTLDLQQFAVALRSVDATLRSIEDGSTPLGQFVLGDAMYRDLLRRLVQIQAGLRTMQNTTGQIGGILYTDAVYRRIEAPLLALDRSLALAQSGQGAMGRLLRDSSQYDDLRASFAGLRKSVADFRGGELLQSDALYAGANRMLASWIQKVDSMNADPLFSSSSVYDNLNGFAAEMRDNLRDFRRDPRKYLRMGIF